MAAQTDSYQPADTGTTQGGTTQMPDKTITRDAIVSFIKANEHRANPGAKVRLGVGQSSSCVYFDEPDPAGWAAPIPSCVIGNVLAQFGITPATHFIQNESANSLFNSLAYEDDDITFEAGVGDFANDVQSHADRGYTWGTALQLALIKRGEAG